MDEPTPAPPNHAAWGARFGWVAGGVLGLFVGFAATYAVEVLVLRSRVSDATAAASRAAAVLVPALFFAGALAGHAFGARGGASRYKALGAAAGVAVLALAYAALALAR